MVGSERQLSAFLAAFLTASTAVAQPAIGVSPGRTDRPSTLAATRPTFSWAAVAGAEAYEIVVYDLSGAAASPEATPVISVEVPGGALVWTPDDDSALEPGRVYGWVVRALGAGMGPEEGSDWSEPRLFEVTGRPSIEEVRRALDTLRRFAAAGERDAGSPADRTTALGDPQPGTAGEASARESDTAERGPAVIEDPTTQTLTRGFTFTEEPRFSVITGPNELGARIATISATNAEIGAYLMIGEGTDDYEGIAALDIAGDEIGMLGIARDTGGNDNFGVVGFSDVWGGRFINESGANEVRLAGASRAIDADGAVDVAGPLTWDCPAGMQRIGAWCIDSTINGSATLTGALTTCHNEGKILCPLQALMICDQLGSGVGQDCRSRTGGTGAPIRAFGTWTDRDGSNLQRANPYNQGLEWNPDPSGVGAPTPQIRPVSSSTSLEYFCCKPVSP